MEEEKINRDEDSYRQEYREVCRTLLHYSNLRFAILTVYFGILLGLVVISFNINITLSDPSLRILARIAGIITTIIFWIFGERTIIFSNQLNKRAFELEKHLQYQLFSLRKEKSKFRFIRITYATRFLYFSIFIFWIYALFI